MPWNGALHPGSRRTTVTAPMDTREEKLLPLSIFRKRVRYIFSIENLSLRISMPSPGVVGNPNFVPGHKLGGARPLGSRNRRTKEIYDRLRERGDKDPVDFLSEVVTNADNKHNDDLRVQASALLAPYLHSKCGATPPSRFIEHPLKLPHLKPATIDEVNNNIAYLNQVFAAGTLDLDFYNALLAGQREHIASFKALSDDGLHLDQTIRIEGGLPPLPGTQISMPELNGQKINGVLAAPLDPAIEQTPPMEATNDTEIQRTPDQPETISSRSDVG